MVGALAGRKAYDSSQGACATSSHLMVVVWGGWTVLPDFLNAQEKEGSGLLFSGLCFVLCG